MTDAYVRGTVRVRVPATSANLGPGFDSLGLALGLVDEVTAAVVDEPGVHVQVIGEGAGEVPCGPEHLVARALLATLGSLRVPTPAGLALRCVNAVPHGRGLGSSAAAVVAGVLAGRALSGQALAGRALSGQAVAEPALSEPFVTDGSDDEGALGLATSFEGHPDNAAAALLGGATIAWIDGGRPQAVRIDLHPDVVPLVLLPTGRLPTHHARSVLPASVSHEDAAANVAASALLVHALTREPGLLLPATRDRLHQRQRRTAMPATIDLVRTLRADGLAAVVSGAGPAVLVLSTTSREATDVAATSAAAPSWQLLRPGVCRTAATALELERGAMATRCDAGNLREC